MGKKIKPMFGSPVEDSGSPGALQAVRMNVEALLKWAQITEHKVVAMENAIVNYEQALVQINGSLEGACRLLIEHDLMDQDKLHSYAKEYVDAHNALREEQVKKLAEAMDREKSPIWMPGKKKIIAAR